MKQAALAFVVTAFFAQPLCAAPIDAIGGADSSTQTIYHCGYLPTTNKLYTSSPATTRIVERKLAELGYHPIIDGNFGKMDKLAVKHFQSDYGLKADGVVGPLTAQRLAFISHPSSHVRGCQRVARG